METLTHTKRRDFKNCRRYFLHRHIDHLTPRIQKKGRRRGTIFGETLFDVRQAEANDPAGHDTWDEFTAKAIADAYDDLRETGNLDPDALAELDVEQAKMEIMVLGYIEKYGVDDRREIEYDLPLVNPSTGRSSRAFRRGGKIDGAIMLGNKRVRIIEDKLVSQIQKVMIDRLPLDDQVTEYVDAFMAMSWSAEVAYRHTRFPTVNPKPPKEFKTKDDYPGETLEEFKDRLWEDLGERPEFYFDEQVLWFPTEHMEDYRLGRWGTAQSILAARREAKRSAIQRSVQFPLNPSRCWEYGGCEFIPLCTKQQGAEALYVVTEDNPELTHGKEDEAVTSEYGPSA